MKHYSWNKRCWVVARGRGLDISWSWITGCLYVGQRSEVGSINISIEPQVTWVDPVGIGEVLEKGT